MLTPILRLLFGLCLAWNATASPLDREIILVPQSGNQREDAEIARWQERARATAAGAEVFERLGWAYIAKARRTQDAGFYKLAEKTAAIIDAQFGATLDSRLLRGHVLHNLHHFREAEASARSLVADRGSPADLALLSDALMEQGKLGEAVTVLGRLVNVKPGVDAFSRIAQVRWLKGELAGATAAMESALAACAIRDAEVRAWLLTRLSGYHLQSGEVESALSLAEASDKAAPDYAPALLARGRALLALQRTEEAIGSLQSAARLDPLPEYQWWLADALRLGHRLTEAAAVEAKLKARGAMSDPRTFALFLATRQEDTASAVSLARAELEQRADVFTHDALAWALAANGELAAAAASIRHALSENTRDARLLLHAGEIARLQRDSAKAAGYFAAARLISGTLTPSERALLERRLAGDSLAHTN